MPQPPNASLLVNSYSVLGLLKVRLARHDVGRREVWVVRGIRKLLRFERRRAPPLVVLRLGTKRLRLFPLDP